MINLIYAQKILNALFHTGGSAGLSAEDEMAQFINDGLPSKSGVTAQLYFNAFVAAGYKASGETELKYNAIRSAIDNSQHYKTENDDTVSFDYKIYDNSTDKHIGYTVSYTGWKIKSKIQEAPYPTTAYLALFTEMPDENGFNYVEPVVDDVGASTTYIRVNLHAGIITGENALNTATKDEESGKSFLDNRDIIMYPEIYGSDWGTICGFGVFEEEEPMTGNPVFWGRLYNKETETNDTISATTGHVPLFRVGDFQISLQ